MYSSAIELARCVLITIIIFCYSSCGNVDKNVKHANAQNLSLDNIAHERLNDSQIHRIVDIQKALAEVNPVSLKETIENFNRDVNPDNEIEVWEEIVQAFDKFNQERSDINLEEKKEVYRLLLMRSMMPAERVIAQLKLEYLDKESAEKVLSYYEEEHKPVLFREG